MKKRNIRKIPAILLSAVLSVTAIPLLPVLVTTVNAAESIAPTLEQFATKDELFTSFDTDDTTDTGAHKVCFGKNGLNDDQEWWIAGMDPAEGNTDGLVLLAASPLATGQVFNSEDSEKAYSGDWGCDYGDSSPPTSVYSNHYGGSELRARLKELEIDEIFFTLEEQGRMQDTTIYTNDIRNNAVYSTADKLYAAYGEFGGEHVTVGTNRADGLNNGLRVTRGYWGKNAFWLRAPYKVGGLVAGGPNIGSYAVNFRPAVLPAFQLNLTSILFASAAPAATSEEQLTMRDAFTLRYDAEAELGGAEVNTNETAVSIRNAVNDSYLVVQNRDGAYAKAINSDTSTISASEIIINNAKLTSFSGCKVWIEKTDPSNRITKAVMAKPESWSVDITAGANMTKTDHSGDAAQDVKKGTAITNIVYLAEDGYYFPEDYSVTSMTGISVTRDSYTQITVAGTPTGDTSVTLSAAIEKAEQDEPKVTGGVKRIIGTASTMEYASLPDAARWKSCTDTSTAVSEGTWYVRYKETETKKAGIPKEVRASAEIIFTHGHHWDTSFTSDADYHWHECTAASCPITKNSEKDGYAAHTWDAGSVTKAPTYTNAGVKTLTCTVCKRTKTEELPKLLLATPKITISTTYNSAKLSWNSVKGADGYQVYRAAKKNGSYKKVKTTKAKSWINHSLITGRTYCYKVRAYKKEGSRTIYGSFSKTVKAVPKTKAPSFKLRAGNDKITVTWNKVSGADGYKIYRARSKNGTYKMIKDSRGRMRSYTSTRLSNHYTYYYKMRSYKMVKGKKVYSVYSSVKSKETR